MILCLSYSFWSTSNGSMHEKICNPPGLQVGLSAACGRRRSRSCTEQAGPCQGTAFAPEADDWRGPGCSHCEGGLFAGHVEGPWSMLQPDLEVFHHVPLMPGCSMHWNHECDVFFGSFLLSINDELLGKVPVLAFRLFQTCPQVIIPLRVFLRMVKHQP